MPHQDTDRIAREAARLLALKSAATIDQAIHMAVESLGLSDAPLPGHGRVRQHAQAMAMQAMGSEAYDQSVRRVMIVAEELMTGLEELFAGAKVLLVGRAARGHVDADAAIHVRIYTDASITDLAQALVDFGYEEPTFHTASTRFGRLNQLRLAEDSMHIVVTRLLPDMAETESIDLFTGQPTASVDVRQIRQRLGMREDGTAGPTPSPPGRGQG